METPEDQSDLPKDHPYIAGSNVDGYLLRSKQDEFEDLRKYANDGTMKDKFKCNLIYPGVQHWKIEPTENTKSRWWAFGFTKEGVQCPAAKLQRVPTVMVTFAKEEKDKKTTLILGACWLCQTKEQEGNCGITDLEINDRGTVLHSRRLLSREPPLDLPGHPSAPSPSPAATPAPGSLSKRPQTTADTPGIKTAGLANGASDPETPTQTRSKASAATEKKEKSTDGTASPLRPGSQTLDGSRPPKRRARTSRLSVDNSVTTPTPNVQSDTLFHKPPYSATKQTTPSSKSSIPKAQRVDASLQFKEQLRLATRQLTELVERAPVDMYTAKEVRVLEDQVAQLEDKVKEHRTAYQTSAATITKLESEKSTIEFMHQKTVDELKSQNKTLGDDLRSTHSSLAFLRANLIREIVDHVDMDDEAKEGLKDLDESELWSRFMGTVVEEDEPSIEETTNM